MKVPDVVAFINKSPFEMTEMNDPEVVKFIGPAQLVTS